MGKQRRQRSWVRLLLTSALAGAGLAALRSYLRPAVPPALTPSGPAPSGPASSAPAPSVATSAPPNREAAPPRVEKAPAAATVGLTKSRAVSEPVSAPEHPAQAEPEAELEAAVPLAPPVAAGASFFGNPDLAFVAEPTTPMYMPPASQGSRWDPPTGPEWLPGFGPGGAVANDPWTSTGTLPGPVDVPPAKPEGFGARLREWRYQTPRRQMVFTILGIVCLVAAVVTTVLVLAL